MKKKDVNKYAYLDQLSTQALREILRADIDSPESGDDEAILYILEVMEKRQRKDPSHDPSSDLDRCWNEFQTLYNTPEGTDQSLYPTERPSALSHTSGRRKFRRLRRIVLAAAVLALLVVSLTVPVAGYNSILEMLGAWTSEQFAVRSVDDGPGGPVEDFDGAENFEDTLGEELRVVLAEHGITEAVVPQWLPEGFKLQGDVLVQESRTSHGTRYFAYYSRKTDFLSITIADHVNDETNRIYEKTASIPVIYQVNDVEHYIFNNNTSLGAVWYVGDLECAIDTSLSQADLEKVLDSIYEE